MGFHIFFIFVFLLLSIAAHGLNPRIIGGISANIQEFPYIVSFRNIEDNMHFCAGSIISHWNVLTAVHCFEDMDNQFDDIRIYSGTSSSSDISGQNYTIGQIIFHADYEEQAMLEISDLHDIAIIKTNERIEFNEYQNKINLPTRDVFPGNVGRVAGWGLTSFPVGKIAPFLRQAAIHIYDHVSCAQLIPVYILESQLCVFNARGVGTCEGDSGGPLVSNNEIFGIISQSFRCASGVPDIQTKVYSYLDFIRIHIED